MDGRLLKAVMSSRWVPAGTWSRIVNRRVRIRLHGRTLLLAGRLESGELLQHLIGLSG